MLEPSEPLQIFFLIEVLRAPSLFGVTRIDLISIMVCSPPRDLIFGLDVCLR